MTATESRPIEILLVEDNPGDMRLTKEALRETKVNNRLHWAQDGSEALDFLHRRKHFAAAPQPDIILLDLNLPKQDGHDVLMVIKNDADLLHIPVVMLTTSSAEEDVRRSYELHANCYVTKPVDFDKFMKVIRTIDQFWLTLAKLPSMATA